jgi:hypothetical protein
VEESILVRSLYARRVWALVFLPLLAIVVGVWGATGTALAHGHTTVGDYELVIGFHGEPAYQDEPNGLDLFVTNTKTGEKVNGLASTLGAEIIYGTSKKAVQLKPQFGEDGAYTAYVLPTEAGNYPWHIFGMIKTTPVDLKMTSSPQTFSAVQPKSNVAFPSALPSPSALQQQIDSVNRLAVIALTVGVLGLLAGAGGVYYGLRNRAPTAVSLEAERAAAHNDA